MGAEESRPSHSARTGNNKKYSQDEVDRILRIEKLRIEKNVKDEMARNAARQKVEELLLQSKNLATSSAPSPSLETSSASKPSTQNELHLLMAKRTATNPNPTADNVRPPSERSNVASNATNNNPQMTSPQTPGNVNTTIVDTEAQSSASKPSTYSFTQNELHLLMAKSTVTNPNPTNVASNANATNNNRTNPQTPGNVNTTIIDTEAQRNNKKYSQDEVDTILRIEKLNSRLKRIEKNVKDEMASSASKPSTYSFTQNELHLLMAKSTVTNPNPTNVASNANATNNNKTNPQTPGNVNTTIIDTEAQRNNKKYSQDEVDTILRIEKLNSRLKRIEKNVKDEMASSASKPSTYSFTQNELHLLMAKSTVTNPNPTNVASNANATNNNRTNPQTPGNVNTTIIDTEAQRLPKIIEQPKTTCADADGDDELNCYTCKRKYSLNIYQCPRGHSSCHLCRASLALCGVCGSPVGDMRNNALEAYIAQRKIRCPNSQDGCCMVIKMADLEAHTRQCLFRELACPLADIFGLCRWRGKLQQISKHFDETHPYHRTGNVDTEMELSLNDPRIVHLVVVGSFHFLFHLRVCGQRRAAYMVVQLIGTKNGAAKWSYEIYVYSKSEPRRKYHYTGVCQSINTPLTQIIADENCATLSFDYIGTFMNNNRVNYKFYIKRDVESGPARYPAYGGARNRSWVRRSSPNNN